MVYGVILGFTILFSFYPHFYLLSVKKCTCNIYNVTYSHSYFATLNYLSSPWSFWNSILALLCFYFSNVAYFKHAHNVCTHLFFSDCCQRRGFSLYLGCRRPSTLKISNVLWDIKNLIILLSVNSIHCFAWTYVLYLYSLIRASRILVQGCSLFIC